jgi:hypothetical protein
VVALSLTLLSADPASATPFLSAFTQPGGSNGGCVGGGGSISSGAPVSSEIICTDSLHTASAEATAILGSLGAEAHGLEFFGFSSTFAGGTAFYSDTVVFSGPGTGPISATLNVHFGGSLNSTDGAGATVNATASLAGSTVGSIVLGVHNGVLDFCENTFIAPTCGTSPDGTLSGSSVLVDLNTPVPVALRLEVGAGANGIAASATSLFSTTLSFATGGPVFDLPAGFTANAGDYLVNNRFITEATPVPEPSTLALVVAGIFCLATRRRTAGFLRPPGTRKQI